jgi:hypothetical protein
MPADLLRGAARIVRRALNGALRPFGIRLERLKRGPLDFVCDVAPFEDILRTHPLARPDGRSLLSHRVGTPSYEAIKYEFMRMHQVMRTRGMMYRGLEFNSKQRGYELARELGLETPRTFVPTLDYRSLDETLLPAECVVKPHGGADSHGVFLLEAAGAGAWREVMTGEILDVPEIIARYAREVANNRATDLLSIEELLRPSGPTRHGVTSAVNVKVWCAGPQPLMVRTSEWRPGSKPGFVYRCWGIHGEDVGELSGGPKSDLTLPMVTHFAEIVSQARRVAERLDLPFVRLDFYDTSRGPVFGEVTPFPGMGGGPWAPAFDRIFGTLIELARADLILRGVPIAVPLPADQ